MCTYIFCTVTNVTTLDLIPLTLRFVLIASESLGYSILVLSLRFSLSNSSCDSTTHSCTQYPEKLHLRYAEFFLKNSVKFLYFRNLDVTFETGCMFFSMQVNKRKFTFFALSVFDFFSYAYATQHIITPSEYICSYIVRADESFCNVAKDREETKSYCTAKSLTFDIPLDETAHAVTQFSKLYTRGIMR